MKGVSLLFLIAVCQMLCATTALRPEDKRHLETSTSAPKPPKNHPKVNASNSSSSSTTSSSTSTATSTSTTTSASSKPEAHNKPKIVMFAAAAGGALLIAATFRQGQRTVAVPHPLEGSIAKRVERFEAFAGTSPSSKTFGDGSDVEMVSRFTAMQDQGLAVV